MPDILIRGMEMPPSCTKCPFEAFGDCYGGKVKRIMDIEDYMERGERHPDCPLIELPQHGDLIDRDAILNAEKTKPIAKMMMFGGTYVYDESVINDAPVVVPAERSEP